MQILQWVGTFLGVILQLMVISALIRGRLRTYPFLFILIISEFLSTIVGVAATLDTSGWTRETAKYYWITEVVDYALIYACLVHLLAQTVEGGNGRKRIAWVVLLGFLFVILSTVQSYNEHLAYWMTQLVRNVSFGSMFVTLTLWTLLIRKPNRQRLMVAAGLGIQLAGSAIGHSLRSLSTSLVWLGNLVLLSVYLLFLYTIWKAFQFASTTDKDEAETNTPIASTPRI